MSEIYTTDEYGHRVPVAGDNPFPVKVGEGNAHIGEVGGRCAWIDATIVRPFDVTQYAAGDVVGTNDAAPILFAGAARKAEGSGFITHLVVIDSANAVTKATLELYLFDQRPDCPVDNTAWAPTDGDLDNCFAVISSPTWKVGNPGAAAAGNALAYIDNLSIPYRCVEGRDLWGILVERGTYTPVASERIRIRLGVAQD